MLDDYGFSLLFQRLRIGLLGASQRLHMATFCDMKTRFFGACRLVALRAGTHTGTGCIITSREHTVHPRELLMTLIIRSRDPHGDHYWVCRAYSSQL